ncbi:MAG: glycosyltransferase family 39 protein [Planctomycetes bacterium]|nr:glycosyltransferase family 39 protein [Planctomycetota bacterium]
MSPAERRPSDAIDPARAELAPASPNAADEAPLHTQGVHGSGPRRVPAWAFGAALLALGGLWALDRWVFQLSILTPFRGLRAASPIYAYWDPVVRTEALVFVLAGLAFVALAPRLADPTRTPRRAFVAALFVLAAVLPFALFLARKDPASLGSTFQVYKNEEFWDDALKVPMMRDAEGRTGASAFLAHYVEAMPRLSLHGQHFPPGHALFLHGMIGVFGPRLPAAGAVVLGLAALGVLFAFLALRTLLAEHAARQGALLLVALPPFLDFTCTSMDAAFFAWAALATWTALRALRKDARVLDALLAGLALAFAALSSFAVLPLGLVFAVYAVVLGARRERAWSALARQLLAIGVAFALGLVLVRLATGFAWWDCLFHARSHGLELMTKVLKRTPSSLWAPMSYGNGAAYVIGAGAGVLALLLARGSRERAPSSGAPRRDSWTIAALATFAVMTVGGLFFMETERIWLFTLPWIAGVALAPGALEAASLRKVLGLALAQALLFEALLFTLW